MRALEVDTQTDLKPLLALLHSRGIRLRAFEERGVQIVEVADAAEVQQVQEAYRDWQAGRLQIELRPGPAAPSTGLRLWAQAKRAPIVCGVILIAVLCYPWVSVLAERQVNDLVLGMLFTLDLEVTLAGVLESAQVWRWVTPIWIHFSVYHLVFNCLVVWEFGRRLERVLGSVIATTSVLIIAVISNFAQGILGGSPKFGGLSGVAYGLLGFVLVMRQLRPAEAEWQVPIAFAISLLVFLVLFSTGATELFGLHVANYAHWFGLGAGAALGWTADRWLRARSAA